MFKIAFRNFRETKRHGSGSGGDFVGVMAFDFFRLFQTCELSRSVGRIYTGTRYRAISNKIRGFRRRLGDGAFGYIRICESSEKKNCLEFKRDPPATEKTSASWPVQVLETTTRGKTAAVVKPEDEAKSEERMSKTTIVLYVLGTMALCALLGLAAYCCGQHTVCSRDGPMAVHVEFTKRRRKKRSTKVEGGPSGRNLGKNRRRGKGEKVPTTDKSRLGTKNDGRFKASGGHGNEAATDGGSRRAVERNGFSSSVAFFSSSSSLSAGTGGNWLVSAANVQFFAVEPVILGFAAPKWKYRSSELRSAANCAAKALKMNVKEDDILNKSREESEKRKRGGDYKQ